MEKRLSTTPIPAPDTARPLLGLAFLWTGFAATDHYFADPPAPATLHTLIAATLALQLAFLVWRILRLRKQGSLRPRDLWAQAEVHLALWIVPVGCRDPSVLQSVLPFLAGYTLAQLARLAFPRGAAYELALNEGWLSLRRGTSEQWRILASDILDVRTHASPLRHFLRIGPAERIVVHTRAGQRLPIPAESLSVYQVRALVGLPPLPDPE